VYNDREKRYCYGELRKYPKKIDKDTFDGVVLEIKEQTLRKLLHKYPNGISINEIGWMCPLGEESYFDNEQFGEYEKMFGKKFI